MRLVGVASGTKIHAPDDSYFSFYNSPYISHGQGSSVDIYPHHQSWTEDVVSPVSGQVVRIKKMQMGRPKGFPTEDYDYGIGIQSDSSQGDIVRILHCEPTISIGDLVETGDKIGVTLRSRFFNYWTGPHYHVEVMGVDSFERSSKSYPFLEIFSFSREKAKQSTAELAFEISEVTQDHIKGFPRGIAQASISDLRGLAGIDKDNMVLGILDGGLSHYKQGGVVGGLEIEMKKQVFFAGNPVGSIINSNRFLRGPAITSYLDGNQLRGLSCFVYPVQYTRKGVTPLVLVPQQYDQFRGVVEVGDVCSLKITGQNNTVKAD
ncbi:MAG: hypothetical protein ACW98U_04485 [Candidatus Thorarchaeota archaeon]|jgi:murein DD-endopeptidase MepM/ murein hydrolase activator NlpD